MEDVHGNRGKCAQGCRLPYTLLDDNKALDNGYLLSPKDLCSLELLPQLLKTGINSLKIEGRMKSPEYVAITTKIYRKYIDKILNNEKYIIDNQDKRDLLQVFNRGGFSTGHLENIPNKDFIFKEKPNHMGIYIGNVSKYHANKGHITFTLNNEAIHIGDTISFEKENTTYTISELMQENQNLTCGNAGSKLTIGRMKGKINVGDKIYKLSSKELLDNVKKDLSVENKKQPLSVVLDVHLDEPIELKLYDNNNHQVIVQSEEFPEVAIHSPITKERLEEQLNKLGDAPYSFKNIKINLDNNLFLPHIRTINELRRTAIQKYSDLIIHETKRKSKNNITYTYSNEIKNVSKHKISLLLNILNFNFDYSKLENVDKLYIPLKFFYLKEFNKVIENLANNFPVYLYLPNILKSNFKNLFKDIIDNSLNKFKIKGFVISNLGYLDLLKEYTKKYEFIGNYNLNIFNNASCSAFDFNSVTISPELNKEEINIIASNCKVPSEFIVYGNLPLMTSTYCLLGKTNKCYPECEQKCKIKNSYYIKDRMNFLFRVIPDNIQTITTIYNSKITSVDTKEIAPVINYRIDILDETIEEINSIIESVKMQKRLEGKNYTNGNFNRCV